MSKLEHARTPAQLEELLFSNNPEAIEEARLTLKKHYREETGKTAAHVLSLVGRDNIDTVNQILEVCMTHAITRYQGIPASGGEISDEFQRQNTDAETQSLDLLTSQLSNPAPNEQNTQAINRYITNAKTLVALMCASDELLPKVMKDPSLGGIPTAQDQREP